MPDNIQVDPQILSIIEANKNKNFVKRMLNPSKGIKLSPGVTNTHLMSWEKLGDEFIAFPQIVEQDGELKNLKPDEAYKYAIESGEYIAFDNSKEAANFSKQYKDIWDKKPEFNARQQRLIKHGIREGVPEIEQKKLRKERTDYLKSKR